MFIVTPDSTTIQPLENTVIYFIITYISHHLGNYREYAYSNIRTQKLGDQPNQEGPKGSKIQTSKITFNLCWFGLICLYSGRLF